MRRIPSITKQLRVAGRVWRDPRVGPAPRRLLLAALVYLVLPLHVVPQRVGPLRAIQTLLVLGAVLGLIVWRTPRDVLRDARAAVA